MSRPEVDFREQSPGKKDHKAIVRAIHELSIYPIHRAYRDVKTKTTSYSMDPELDRIILVNLSVVSVNATITLPDAPNADYTEYVIVLIANHASPNTLTVATSGSSTINGSSTLTTETVYDSVRVTSDGTNYFRTDINS